MQQLDSSIFKFVFLFPLFPWLCVFINIEQHLEAIGDTILFYAPICDWLVFPQHFNCTANATTISPPTRIIHRWQCCSNKNDKWLRSALHGYNKFIRRYMECNISIESYEWTHVSICGAMAVVERSQQTWDWFGLFSSVQFPIQLYIDELIVCDCIPWRRWRKKTDK